MFFQQILFHQTAYSKYESFLCWDIKEEDMFTSLLTLHLIHFHFSSILHLLFRIASPQVIKQYHRIRTVTSLGDQKFSSPLESYETTIIHSPSLTKMLLWATSRHLFLSCLELGVTGTEEKGVTFLCSLLGTVNTLLPFPR